MRKIVVTLVLAVATLLTGVATAQQQSVGPEWVWAAKYNRWALPGVSPNTYTFNAATNCIVDPYSGRSFNFNTNAPVYINDLGLDSNSEIVTPTSIVTGVGTCGFAANPTHTHLGFQVQSGTAGLQEALNSFVGGSASYPGLILLDATWWGQANAISTGTSIIAAASGSTKVQLWDVTSGTMYKWNGSAYIASGFATSNYGNLVNGQFFGYKNTSVTALAPPTAGTFGVSANSSGIAAATYRVAQTCVDPLGGETLISTDTSTTVTTTSSNGNITATFPTCPAGSVGWELYISAASGAAGSEIFYAPGTVAGCTLSTQGVKPSCALTSGSVTSALVTSTSKVPDQATAYAMAIEAQDVVPTPYLRSWPPFAVTGVQTASSAYTLAQITFPAGYLNQIGKSVQICGNYNVTPSSTGTDVVTVLGINAFNQSPNTLITWTSGALTNAAYEAPFCFTMTTAVTGASGTVEIHGKMTFNLASTGVAPGAGGYTDANTSTATLGDLTKAITISLQSTPGSSNVTQGQMRQFTVTPLN